MVHDQLTLLVFSTFVKVSLLKGERKERDKLIDITIKNSLLEIL